jgi:hypothetical protein
MGAGADVDLRDTLPAGTDAKDYDAILVALKPRGGPVLSAKEANTIAKGWPGVVVAQFWGDIEREYFRAANVDVWPLEPPAPGHMGILPSGLGPEPIIRLQSGGLKVGEVLSRYSTQLHDDDTEFIQLIGAEDPNG